MATSTFVPNFSIFDPPSPTYSSTISDSISSMSPSTPSNSSPSANVDNYPVFNASSGDFNFDGQRQGQNLNSQPSGDWSSEGKGSFVSSGQDQQEQSRNHFQQYHYLPQQELQTPKYFNQINQQRQSSPDPNVFPIQQQQQPFHSHQFQSLPTGFQAQQGEQIQQPQLALAQPSKSTTNSAAKPTKGAGKKGSSSQRKSRSGDDGAQKRAIHNATERARRETLNGRFLELASVIPATSAVRKPSKPLIVKSALSFVEEAMRVETLYRDQIDGLSSENERLLNMLNAERKKLGLESIVSQARKDFVMPAPLSEMKSIDPNSNQEEEGENDSENGYGLGGGSQEDFQSSIGTNQSVDNESDSGLSNSYGQHFNDLSGFSMHPTFFHRPEQQRQRAYTQSNLGHFTAPIEALNSTSSNDGQHQDGMFFPANFNDGRRHSVTGLTPTGYPQNF